MFFTSGIIIAFFCFAFYLIWNQFLKKDTRLSIGLQVLRKKISDLENLSLAVDAQGERHRSNMKEKSQDLELLLQQGRELCRRLEKNIEITRALQNIPPPVGKETKGPVMEDQPVSSSMAPPAGKNPALLQGFASSEKEGLSSLGKEGPASSETKQAPDPVLRAVKDTLKTVKEKKPVQEKQKFYFGESPFTNMDFTDSP